ncbi:hypothetical protein F4804DRAFT_11893 [Jackrogersella minutella]|nr:hypothetical protein F4804DRAFT_11893 [Jackrogersella minutella]
MYSQDETISAVLRFYQEVIRHPYLNDDALIIPSPSGWDSINIQGKTETVLELLRHLPYLRAEKRFDELIIHWETVPICYPHHQDYHEIYPLPAHCVYLAHSFDREGPSLILDTNEGTLTEFYRTGSHITINDEDYEALPEPDKWKAHRTSPITEFLDTWARRYEKLVWMLAPNPSGRPMTGRFYSRAKSSAEEEELGRQGQLEPWPLPEDIHPDDDDDANENENELDREQREERIRHRRHVADVYNIYLRYGWPNHFDKERCRVELLELEKMRDAYDKRRMDEANPDAELFD